MKFFRLFWRVVLTVPLILLTVLLVLVVLSDQKLLPDGPYNPNTQFQIGDPLSGFNGLKLSYAIRSAPACRRLMGATDGVQLLDDYQPLLGGDCGVQNRVRINKINGVDYRGLETRCDTALRLLGWVEYDVKLRATALQREVIRIDNNGSYACRNMRTANGDAGRPSLHSFAKAVDITGVRFADGERVRLINDWDAKPDSAWRSDFLHAIRDDACDWFNGVLSPDYNALHADHFHFDLSNWRFCR